MKNYQYSENKQFKKWRVVAVVFLLGWLVTEESVFEKSELFERLTSQILPLLTYEQEYGKNEMEYDATYSVPEWFDTKTVAGKVNQDTAMAEQQNYSLEESTETVITTLTDGKYGTTYTRKQLKNPDFLLSNIFAVDSNTSMTEEELKLSNLLDMDLTISDLKKNNNLQETKVQASGDAGEYTEPNYKILIYHTHASENFADSREGVQEDTIVGVGTYLAQLLEEQYGIAVYHDTTTYDVIDGVLDRSKAYEYSYAGVTKILEKYPSIEVVIDLHRDGVDEETHLVTDINGKKTAKIMFLNGVSRSDMNGEISYLENPNKLANLAFSFQMYLTGKEYYGDYVRKIYVRSLRYNLHVMPRAALIEVGAQNNTLEEEKNAMEPLAAIIDKVLSKNE